MKKVKSIVFALAVPVLPCSLFAQEQMTTTTTETAGTVSEFSPDRIVIHSETTTSPTSYSFTKKTVYVDDMGNPVSVETVKSGLPVTVYYTQDGDRMVADKVMIRKTTTTTSGTPMMHEEKRTRSTTTTTETK